MALGNPGVQEPHFGNIVLKFKQKCMWNPEFHFVIPAETIPKRRTMLQHLDTGNISVRK